MLSRLFRANPVYVGPSQKHAASGILARSFDGGFRRRRALRGATLQAAEGMGVEEPVIIISMGAGDITQLGERLLSRLRGEIQILD